MALKCLLLQFPSLLIPVDLPSPIKMSAWMMRALFIISNVHTMGCKPLVWFMVLNLGVTLLVRTVRMHFWYRKLIVNLKIVWLEQ